MANRSLPSHIVVLILFITCDLLCILGKASSKKPWENAISSLDHITDRLRTDPDSIRNASIDYGNLVHNIPSAVLYPSSIKDIIDLIQFSNNCSNPFTIAARGQGHSVRGQAMARNGVVVDMNSLAKNGTRIRVSWNPSLGYYADVGGEQLWIDVLRASLEHGVAPVSWTDYLYLTVGGTLSNAGISGQSFLHGPQITNVHQLDVITGKGKLIRCSRNKNRKLFYAVLGGLGQFGIISRARIVLQKASTRVKWVRLLYSDFSIFTKDQENLISSYYNIVPSYVEGFIITNESTINSWTSSFNSPSIHIYHNITSLLKNKGILYSIELVKYYNPQQQNVTITQEFDLLVKQLNFIPNFIFSTDVPLIDFLNRVGKLESQREETHPWLNLFIPKSRIMDFYSGVILNLPKINTQLIIFYPFNRKKWDDRMFAVIPDDDEDDIFYTLGLLNSSLNVNGSKIYDKFNNQILQFCNKAGINIKQYLPHYNSKKDWIKHFGPKWKRFQEMKAKFDPRMILSPGQTVFNYV